jgi:hypothetical protein
MPFTIDEFLGVFKSYNNSIWPFQIILFVSALYVIFLAFRERKFSDRHITLVLVFYWMWIGVVYQLIFFTKINPAAYAFGIIFILQAALFYKAGIIDKKLIFKWHSDLEGYTGGLLILYALIIYPILGMYLGHTYPENPTFGLPCPTTIFTFGILLWAKDKIPMYIIGIPLIWAVIGFTAALNLGIKEDTGLLVAAILSVVLLTLVKMRERKIKTV